MTGVNYASEDALWLIALQGVHLAGRLSIAVGSVRMLLVSLAEALQATVAMLSSENSWEQPGITTGEVQVCGAIGVMNRRAGRHCVLSLLFAV